MLIVVVLCNDELLGSNFLDTTQQTIRRKLFVDVATSSCQKCYLLHVHMGWDGLHKPETKTRSEAILGVFNY